MNKIGDRVFWLYLDDTVGSGTIIDIADDSYIDDEGSIVDYQKYEIANDDPDLGSGVIEDYNCLDESDERVIEYLKTFREKDIMIPLSVAIKWLEENLKSSEHSTFIELFKAAMRNAI